MTAQSQRHPGRGRWFGPLLLAALVLVGVRPFYLGFLLADRTRWGARFEAWPDRSAPAYRDLLLEANHIIPAAGRVAVLFSPLDWGEGYSYAYYRAQYLLAGRIVIPLAWTDRARLDRLDEADYVVAYRSALPPGGGWELLFSSAEGAILRRTR